MTMTNIQIDSDITGRFKRIINQVEFDGNLTFITELLQNAQRGKATEVKIKLDGNTLTIQDNGVGCTEPKDLFTLDFSGFGYGFGEGFSSVYTLLGQVNVRTLNWQAFIDVEQLANKRTLLKEDLEVHVETADFYQGFSVELTSPKIEQFYGDIVAEIRKVTSTMMSLTCTLNGETLPKHDIFAVPFLNTFHDLFDNSLYTGRLYIDEENYQGVDVYYEDRFVENLYYGLRGLSGNILIKANKVNLKAPDRTSIIRDGKRDNLMRQLSKNLNTLLICILKDGTKEEIEQFADIIRSHIPTEKFMRFLRVDEQTIKNQYQTREEIEVTVLAEVDHPLTEERTDGKETPSTPSPVKEQEVLVTSLGLFAAPERKETDTRRLEEDRSFSSFVSSAVPDLERVTKKNLRSVSISNIKRKANVVWVERSNAEEYASLIAKYEYYGIFTFVSPHVLYNDALRFIGITHISEVEQQAIEKQYDVKNIGANSKKERRALEVLSMIEAHLHLPETFTISDIHCKMVVQLQEKKIYQEKLTIDGYAQGKQIHFNRKSLALGKLSGAMLGREQLGLHEVKFVLANIELIAHELAHLIYETEDNTKEHYEKIFSLQDQIGQFVLTHV